MALQAVTHDVQAESNNSTTRTLLPFQSQVQMQAADDSNSTQTLTGGHPVQKNIQIKAHKGVETDSNHAPPTSNVQFLPENHSDITKNPHFQLPHRGCVYPEDADFSDVRFFTKFSAENLDPSLCTYIIIPSGSIQGLTLALTSPNDTDLFRLLRQHKASFPLLKLILSVGGENRTHELSEMVAVHGIEVFAASIAAKLRGWGLDGIDVYWNWEVSPFRSDEILLPVLLQAIRKEFDRESLETGKERLALSTTLQETSQTNSINGPPLGLVVDIVHAVSYDQGNTAFATLHIAHHSPLFGGPLGIPSKANLAQVLQDWHQAGIPKAKLVGGVPLYGRGWILGNSNDTFLGAFSADQDLPSVYTNTSGYWPYYELCQHIKQDNATVVFDQRIAASYAFTKTWWVGYNDEQTLRGKAAWVSRNGFGGLFVKDVSLDDFAGTCGPKYPLLNVIRDEQAKPNIAPPKIGV
ncbi:putative Acidic mammalian chitinase [Hypsibius exemplaris]|uniref:Acidic mammalian chitinase n=1 Tax=Hypsibius exemplaris TaxID=2072580 RepID=A0A9X6NM21_HYPEX|nr:putative Acidic mammalian chitinase [Hypsibius exemplaris]